MIQRFKDDIFNIKRISDIEQGLIQDIEEYINQPKVNLEDELDKSYLSEESGEESEHLFKQSISPLEIKDEINIQHYDSVMWNK